MQFVPGAYRLRRGPADESEDDDLVSHHGQQYARTPFPQFQTLNGPPSSMASPPIIPGQRPRSYSNPGQPPLHYGSPEELGGDFGSPESVERGPFRPPQPGVRPTKSALRRSGRPPTMDAFASPPFQFPQADQGMMPPGMQAPGHSLYGQPPNGFMSPPIMPNGYSMPGQPSIVPTPSDRYGNPLPFMSTSLGPTPRMTAMPTPTGFPTPGLQQMPPAGFAGMPGMMPQPGGMPMGMPPPRVRPATGMPEPSIPPSVLDAQLRSLQGSARHGRRRRRYRGGESSESSDEGVHPALRRGGNENPLPQPPRVLAVPTGVSPDGSIMVDSPPAGGRFDVPPPIPPKPPPNPLPTPPKAIIHDAAKSDALQKAAEDVKRAKEHTEKMRDKAIAQLEADTWAAHGVPVGVTEDNEPHVPLIPGVTAPAVFSNVGRSKKPEQEQEQEREEVESHPHGLGLGSILKRLSTKKGPPPPIPPKPTKRASAVPSRRPMFPTSNSGEIPREDGVFPRSARPRSASMSNLPYVNEFGPVVNGQQFRYPSKPGHQVPMEYDERRGEYYDPTNGLYWNPMTRKYYQDRDDVVGPLAGKRKGEKDGLISTLKRWTTNTAPDHQPKPITTQLVFPRAPGATTGLKGVKAVGSVPPVRGPAGRASLQQPRVNVYPDHATALGSGHARSRSEIASRRGTMPSGSQPGTARRGQFPPGMTGNAMEAASALGDHAPPSEVYFSRKSDPYYGGFCLHSPHPVTWGGVTAPTAMHWFQAGAFENVGTGLGASGMETGWTIPSRLNRGITGRGGRGSGGKASRFFKAFSKSDDGNSKNARMEYARARTDESEHIMVQRTMRDVLQAASTGQLEGQLRPDWQRVLQSKLVEILYLKFQQHEGLRRNLLATENAPIIFDNEDSLLGNGGAANGERAGGANELGRALVHVRGVFQRQLMGDVEG